MTNEEEEVLNNLEPFIIHRMRRNLRKSTRRRKRKTEPARRKRPRVTKTGEARLQRRTRRKRKRRLRKMGQVTTRTWKHSSVVQVEIMKHYSTWRVPRVALTFIYWWHYCRDLEFMEKPALIRKMRAVFL